MTKQEFDGQIVRLMQIYGRHHYKKDVIEELKTEFLSKDFDLFKKTVSLFIKEVKYAPKKYDFRDKLRGGSNYTAKNYSNLSKSVIECQKCLDCSLIEVFIVGKSPQTHFFVRCICVLGKYCGEPLPFIDEIDMRVFEIANRWVKHWKPGRVSFSARVEEWKLQLATSYKYFRE